MTLILGNKKEDAFSSYMKQMQFCDINFKIETKEFATANTMLSLQICGPWLFALRVWRFPKNFIFS